MSKKVEFVGTAPYYATPGAAGADLFAGSSGWIDAGERKLVPTGTFVQIPEGYVGLIHPRSGLANKHGITVLNTPGTIDSDYRGEIFVMLYNSSRETWKYEYGDRIAQLVIQAYEKVEFVKVDDLTVTIRNTDGFGSTGV